MKISEIPEELIQLIFTRITNKYLNQPNTSEIRRQIEIELTEAIENIHEQPEIKLLFLGREDEFKLEPKIKLTNITIQQ